MVVINTILTRLRVKNYVREDISESDIISNAGVICV